MRRDFQGSISSGNEHSQGAARRRDQSSTRLPAENRESSVHAANHDANRLSTGEQRTDIQQESVERCSSRTGTTVGRKRVAGSDAIVNR